MRNLQATTNYFPSATIYFPPPVFETTSEEHHISLLVRQYLDRKTSQTLPWILRPRKLPPQLPRDHILIVFVADDLAKAWAIIQADLARTRGTREGVRPWEVFTTDSLQALQEWAVSSQKHGQMLKYSVRGIIRPDRRRACEAASRSKPHHLLTRLNNRRGRGRHPLSGSTGSRDTILRRTCLLLMAGRI